MVLQMPQREPRPNLKGDNHGNGHHGEAIEKRTANFTEENDGRHRHWKPQDESFHDAFEHNEDDSHQAPILPPNRPNNENL